MAASTGNNRGDGRPVPSRRAQLSEDRSVFDVFARILKDKFTGDAADGDSKYKLDRLDELYKQPEYSAEKKLLTDMNSNGVTKGIAVGIGTFIFLRKGPHLIRQYMMRRQGAAAGSNAAGNAGFKLDPTARSQHVSGANPFDKADGTAGSSSGSPGLVFRALKLGLDVFVSLSFAAYGAAILTDKKKLLNDASEIPLVQGRSLLSDELCQDFISQYNKVPAEVWDRHTSNESKKTDPLGAIQTFVFNCHRRAAFEAKIREETGMRKSEHVLIPAPGVPRDIDIDRFISSESAGNGSSDSSMHDTSFTDDYFGITEDDHSPVASGEDSDNDQRLSEWSSIDDFDEKETKTGEGGKGGSAHRRGRGF